MLISTTIDETNDDGDGDDDTQTGCAWTWGSPLRIIALASTYSVLCCITAYCGAMHPTTGVPAHICLHYTVLTTAQCAPSESP